MRRFSDAVKSLVSHMEGGNLVAAREMRRAAVNDVWASSVHAVFKEAASFILEHVNAVYVMSAEQGAKVRRFDRPADVQGGNPGGNVLVVYSDDSMVRSELDARQELLKMKFRERGERIASLKIIPSTGGMRARRPFAKNDVPSACESPFDALARDSHTCGEGLCEQRARELAEVIENPAVRKAATRAMTASATRNGKK